MPVDVQITELKDASKNMEFTLLKYRRRWEESKSKLKELKPLFESVRNERNLFSKNLIEASVSEAFLLLK